MNPTQAAWLAKLGRRLRAAKLLTVSEEAVWDTMLWRLRAPFRDAFTASYTQIARLSGVCRSTVVATVKKLETMGLLIKTKRRLRVTWGRGRSQVASRQNTNAYRLPARSTEFATPTVNQGIERSSSSAPPITRDSGALDDAFAALARSMGLPAPAD
jgi:hypothetical protein